MNIYIISLVVKIINFQVVLAKPVDRDNYVRYTRAHERKPAAVLQPSVQMANGLQGIVSRKNNLKILAPSLQKMCLIFLFFALSWYIMAKQIFLES